ncbi:MAG: PAS domain S-box protein, partial [Planctomycetota bacterium]
MTQTPPVGEFPEFGHSERQLRAIIDGQPNGVVMIDRGGRIVLVNAQLLSDFHYSREELVGQSIEVLLPERFRAGHPGHRDGYFANPSPRAMGAGRNLFGRRKDGSEFPVELGLNPIETEEGMFVLGSVVDISQRKVIEEALEAKQRQVAASEERLKLILDGQPNGMVMINQAGEIVMVNSRLEKDFGYRREEMLGQKIELLVPKRFHRDHPGDRDRFFRDPRARAMGVGRDLFGQRKNGSEFPVELGLNPIETEEGMFVLGSVVDISQRKVIEQELEAKQREVAESEERLKLILDGQPNGMVMINRSGEIVMVNARLENDFGYSRDEMIGQNIELLVPKRFHPKHPGERDGFFQSPRTRVMGAGRDLFGERKDGSEFPVELGLNPISIGDEMFVVGSVVDITERKSAEEKLKALAQSLEVRNQDIRVLLDGVEQGFLTVTPDGVMSEERSGALDRWFGAPTTGMRISDFIAQFDPEAGAWTELGMDQVAP